MLPYFFVASDEASVCTTTLWNAKWNGHTQNGAYLNGAKRQLYWQLNHVTFFTFKFKVIQHSKSQGDDALFEDTID